MFDKNDVPESNRRGGLFDMDGLLINSEPFWASVEKEVFSDLGITLTDAMCRDTQGLRVIEVVQYWYSRYPWGAQNTVDDVKNRIINGVREQILANGVLMPGVLHVMELLARNNFTLAIASSSPVSLIRAVISKFHLNEFIQSHVSAEDCSLGKPYPDVYLTAASMIDIPPGACFAFEDSSTGIKSASAAGATVVAVPENQLPDDVARLCHLQLNSLNDFNDSFLSLLV
ncbi:MAG: HAD-IA family hydrolase [Gammaproteobacteria bacterium]